MAGHDRTDAQRLDAVLGHLLELIHRGDVFPGLEGARVFEQAAADEVLVDLALVVVQRVHDALGGTAVDLAHDDVLRDVDQTTGQISRVGGTQRGVGQALAGAVRRDEVLEHRQAFAEVRLDRTVDDVAVRVGHQAAHAGELADLLDVASSARGGHHVDGIQAVEVGVHRVADFFVGIRPDVDGLTMALFIAHQAHLVIFVDGRDLGFGARQDLFLVRRDRGVVDGHGDAACVAWW